MTTKAIEAGARAAFIAAHNHLDLTEMNDAWGRLTFMHPHVESMWSGWKAAIASGDLVPASAVAAERERCAAEVERRNWPCVGDARRIAAMLRSLSPEPASGEFVVVPRARLERAIVWLKKYQADDYLDDSACEELDALVKVVSRELNAATKDGKQS